MSFYSAHVYYACSKLCGVFSMDYADLDGESDYPDEIACLSCGAPAYEDGAEVWRDGDQVEAAYHSTSHCPCCGSPVTGDEWIDGECGDCGVSW